MRAVLKTPWYYVPTVGEYTRADSSSPSWRWIDEKHFPTALTRIQTEVMFEEQPLDALC